MIIDNNSVHDENTLFEYFEISNMVFLKIHFYSLSRFKPLLILLFFVCEVFYSTIIAVFSCKKNKFLKKCQSSKLNFYSFILIYFSFFESLYILRNHQVGLLVQLEISWYLRTKWFIDRHAFGNGLFQMSSRKDSKLPCPSIVYLDILHQSC